MQMQPPATRCLLLVEDDAETRASLEFSLSRAGYKVTGAANEAQALACLAHERLQLVLIGDSFAAKQGFTLCARLRSLSALPIVILAALNHPDDLAVAFRLGANDYIIKPVPINVLLARLAAVLRRTKANTYQPRRRTILPAKVVCSTPQ
ncbi:MAG: response regulator transcription factor [Caldilineaceae bacterium]